MGERLEAFDTFLVEPRVIKYDDEFNCRGSFTLQSCQQLAESLNRVGMQVPLVVQPRRDVNYDMPKQFSYRMLCGHRRFIAATKILQWRKVPITVRTGLSLFDAKLLNLTENIERKDLNILEEAKAIQAMFPGTDNISEICRTLKRSRPWVKTRLQILELPENVQKKVAAGMIPRSAVPSILESPEEERQALADRLVIKQKKPKSGTPSPGKTQKRINRPSQTKVLQMIDKLMHLGMDGLSTRLLAWSIGNVTDDEINSDISASRQSS